MYPPIIFIIGVSGSGKTTVGRLLAAAIDYPFHDADDYHPPANVKKMADGHALTDADRWPWLDRLHQLARQAPRAVIACSALKQAYRDRLTEGIAERVVLVYLKGDYATIVERMQAREHFMPPALLQSQFDTLEPPENAVTVSIQQSPEEIVRDLVSTLT